MRVRVGVGEGGGIVSVKKSDRLNERKKEC